ncbi:La-related protein 1B [Cardamine amara subsp. amara]|uniref:La-related protein 1B n=1 Tax=Cardamine amara subsp. amara TaxID=228776 RepID=A0ABD1BEL7_CARAN
MATTVSSAANSASRYSTDSSMSRSRHDSDAIHHDPAPSFSQDDPFIGNDTCDYENADKKPAWNRPSNSSAEVGPVMGAESWPALSLSNKSPSFESDGSSSSSSSSMPPPPQVGGTPPDSTSNANVNGGSSAAAAAAISSENHTVNGQRKPFRRNNNTSSSSSNISNPPNPRDQNHTQRGASYGSGTTQFRNPHRNRNNSSYPRGDGLHHGNRRNYEHGNQSAFSNRNYSGRDMHLQPQRGVGMMRPQMLMGPPSFPASSAQYMAAPQLGSYGGPMLYPDYAPHIFMPHPPPESMTLAGHYPPLPMYFPSFDAMLYNKILTQVEYYFSADNLSRDEHLRVQMDDEGWVPVRVIAGFRRLAELTNNIQTILEALRSSEVVEIKGETLRRRGDWDKYLLPHEASKSGPAVAASSNASLGYQLERMTLSERSRDGE